MFVILYPYSIEHSDEPLVLPHACDVVILQQVASHDIGSEEMAGIDEIDDGSTFVEHDGGKLGIDKTPFAVDGDFVARPHNETRRGRGMEEPVLADNEIVGIASTQSDMVGTDGDRRASLRQIVGGVELTDLKGETCEP